MKHFVFSFAVAGIFLVFVGCNQNTGKDSNNSTSALSGGLKILDPVLNQQALAILQTHCASCHGSANVANINYISDVNQLVAKGLVIPGSSATSRVFIRLSSGMPPSGPLSASDISTLENWIDKALAIDTPPGTVAIAPISFAAGTSDLTRQAVTLLSNRCESCHNSASGATTGGGILDMRDPALLIASGLAIPGKSTQSPLYDAVIKHRMPKDLPALSNAESSLLKKWIDTDLINNQQLLGGDTQRELTATFSSINQQIFAPRCTLCHGGSDGTEEGVNTASYRGAKASASKIYDSVKIGDMPARYPDLSANEISVIKTWVDQGAPNN